MEKIGHFTFEPISDKYTEEFIKKQSGPLYYHGDVIVHPSNCLLRSSFKNYVQKIKDFKVYPDDTWVTGFMKTGTTWTQQMVWLLVNDFDFEKAKSVPLYKRFPFLEMEAVWSNGTMTLDSIADMPRPRCIKSHLPVELLPNGLWTVKPKIIYVSREPRDVCISFYHHCRYMLGYTGSLEEFAEIFLADRVAYAPFWTHVLDFKKLEKEPNLLFNTYEEMKKDLTCVIKKTANFLNINVDNDNIERLKEYLSLKYMKDMERSIEHTVHITQTSDVSSKVNETLEILKERRKKDPDFSFVRKGESGGWKKVLNDDLIDKFDKWNKKYLKGTTYHKHLSSQLGIFDDANALDVTK